MSKNKKPTVTLRVLAEQLNLHVTTVSRILNGTKEESNAAASKEVIKKVKDLAKKLQYTPNRHAIGLRTKKTYTIGVLVPKLSDLVLATIYEGIDETANQNNYFTFVSNTEDDPQKQISLGKMLLQRGVDGIIVADARLDNTTFLEQIKQSDTPLVLVSRRLPDFDSVTCDDIAGGALAAQYFIECGHQQIAILAGQQYSSTGQDRLQGFLAVCQEKNIKISPENILYSSFDALSGRHMGEKLFQNKKYPTAIFAVNDFLAIGAMGAIRDSSLRIGEDVAIMGFNDIPLSNELPIGLTTIRSPMHEMGRQAMKMLLQKINRQTIADPHIRLAPELIVRASTEFKMTE